METAGRPGHNGRGGRRRWTPEQKLTVRQEWKTGGPLEEVCRKYAVNAAKMARWKRSLDQGQHATLKRFWCRTGPPLRGQVVIASNQRACPSSDEGSVTIL